MEPTPKEYVLVDIMKKRKRHNQTVQEKVRNKIALRAQRKKPTDIHINPQVFIKQYHAAHKSYSHFRLREKRQQRINDNALPHLNHLLLVIRIRGVKDISNRQTHILNRLRLRKVGTAVFLKGTPANLRALDLVNNYITWGQPSKHTIDELVFKKMYAMVGEDRVQIKSNMQIEQQFNGELLCLEDIAREISSLGMHFDTICSFMYPFKLTTAQNTLVSRLRKPVEKEGHWGYRGEAINQYVAQMI